MHIVHSPENTTIGPHGCFNIVLPELESSLSGAPPAGEHLIFWETLPRMTEGQSNVDYWKLTLRKEDKTVVSAS